MSINAETQGFMAFTGTNSDDAFDVHPIVPPQSPYVLLDPDTPIIPCPFRILARLSEVDVTAFPVELPTTGSNQRLRSDALFLSAPKSGSPVFTDARQLHYPLLTSSIDRCNQITPVTADAESDSDFSEEKRRHKKRFDTPVESLSNPKALDVLFVLYRATTGLAKRES